MYVALRLMLIAILVYVPNQTQFPAEFEVKGFNIINVLMLLTTPARGWTPRAGWRT